MNQTQPRSNMSSVEVRTECVLETYYSQLLEWGALLTRGDASKTEDLVHDFCLHFTLTQPDLNDIANLDGYLYKSLKHIYLSGLARSSREAQQFVSIAEFDSIQFALIAAPLGDPLQKQNDLRRVCFYSVWRKTHTKSASYFILRFFHGYHHQEIADLAGLPISAIYNKLKNARTELRSYIEDPGKLQFTSRELPPVPALLWSPLPSLDLFKELRKTILNARTGTCLVESELIALYGPERITPISCSLLSHIVGCERCLALIDKHLRRPTLKDREPLDDAGSASEGGGNGFSGYGAAREKMLRSVGKHRTEILDHRPRTLSIAVDGKILASHDVQAHKSVLTARIERPENASFVEVFSEQGIRLALLSIGDLPPGAPHGQVQRVILNDGRWLDLNLSFDGMGLSTEVRYFDPALAADLREDGAAYANDSRLLYHGEQQTGKQLPRLSYSPVVDWVRNALRPIASPGVMALSFALACIFCIAGYFMFHHLHAVPVLDVREVLNRSIQVEAANLQGQTEHQVLRFEKSSLDGSSLGQGSIDLWQDGDGKRRMRRLYDSQHRLIAAEWIQRNGQHGQYQKTDDARGFTGESELLADDLWKQDVSSRAFRALTGKNVDIRSTESGYELTAAESDSRYPRLISATLVLDHGLHPVREVMRVQSKVDVHEVRYVQADYERRPASSVPDTIFDPQDQGLGSKSDRSPAVSNSVVSNIRLAQLYIAVLYQLNNIYADTNEPIEVEQTYDQHIRISGTVADDNRKKEILSRLKLMEDRQLLDVRLISSSDALKHNLGVSRPTASSISAYDVAQAKAPADAILRAYFQAQGLSGESLDIAVLGFSHEALEHAQRALQHGAALNRLGSVFPAAELRSISFTSQRQWSEMAAKHTTALETELRALDEQLAQLSSSREQLAKNPEPDSVIESPAQFARAANQLLVKTQNLNRNIGKVFASGRTPEAIDTDSLVSSTSQLIPLRQAAELTSFAVLLNASGRTAWVNR